MGVRWSVTEWNGDKTQLFSSCFLWWIISHCGSWFYSKEGKIAGNSFFWMWKPSLLTCTYSTNFTFSPLETTGQKTLDQIYSVVCRIVVCVRQINGQRNKKANYEINVPANGPMCYIKSFRLTKIRMWCISLKTRYLNMNRNKEWDDESQHEQQKQRRGMTERNLHNRNQIIFALSQIKYSGMSHRRDSLVQLRLLLLLQRWQQ